jgi:subtilisin family serine protease
MKYTLTLITALIFSVSTFAQMNFKVGQVIVRLQNNGNIKTVLNDFQAFNGADTNLEIDNPVSKSMKIWLLKFNTNIPHQAFLDALYMNDNIMEVQSNHTVELRNTTPNDAGYSSQWQYNNTGQSGGMVGADLDAELAWDVTTGGLTPFGDTIVVAAIDEGFDMSHPDLVDNLWINHHEIPNNGIDDDNNGFIDDYRGWNIHQDNDVLTNGGWHGTPVAGIMGAKGNNGIGVTGISWNIKVMCIRLTTTTEADVLEAYDYVLQNRKLYNETNGAAGAFVVATNSSWGINNGQPSQSPLWCAFYDTLGVHGVLSAGATANANFDVDVTGDLPTACPSDYLLSVTNLNDNDQKVTLAGYGLTTIDLGAYGEDIWTLADNGGYASFGGTSGATPHVAGTIGLLYSVPCPSFAILSKTNPDSAALLMKEFIMNGVTPNTSLQGITVTNGRLNILNSVNEMLNNCPATDACITPYALNVTNITDASAILNWGAIIDTTTNFNIQYRAIGSPNWITIMLSDTNLVYTLTGLLPCIDYEVQIEMDCDTTTSGYSNIFNFKTDGCCEPPTNFATNSITDSSAIITWNSILAAQSYDIQYREIGTTSWMNSNGVVNTNILLSNLATCVVYEVQVRTNCQNNNTTVYSNVFTFSTSCGNCSNLSYCASIGLSVADEWIEEVQFGDINNNSGIANSGYTDFTNNLSTTVLTASTYPISVSQGYAGNSFPERFSVWIDYNQSGIFETNELVLNTGTTTAAPNIGSITIPPTALSGSTRMRVSMKFNASATPCESFQYGEVEDYCINIINTGLIPCDALTTLDTLTINETSATLNWSATSNNTSYEVEYREINQASWTSLPSSNTTFQLTSLQAATTYEARIKAICSDTTSDYSNLITFATDWTVNTENLPMDIESFTVFPNPFKNDFSIEINSSTTQDVLIELFDLSGKLMFSQLNNITNGHNKLLINATSLSSGIYLLKIKTTEGIITDSIVKF